MLKVIQRNINLSQSNKIKIMQKIQQSWLRIRKKYQNKTKSL